MVELFQQEEEESLENKLEHVQLINYFKKATSKTPVFLTSIQKKYHEIKPLLEMGLIQCQDPECSYIFNIDKLENYFYSKYQEQIDNLRLKIQDAKRKKKELMKLVAEMEPEEGDPDYDDKLFNCLLFARKATQESQTIEEEREKMTKIMKKMANKMRKDPFFEFLLYIRNDRSITFNKRVLDEDSLIKKKIISYSNACCKNEDTILYKELKKMGFFKAYGPAKSYFITDLGKNIDKQLNNLVWIEDENSYEKNAAEIAQEEEFELIREKFGF
ncbi:MAG: hypothetical protein ACFFBP_00485 [Promethearchaeota archaeon]